MLQWITSVFLIISLLLVLVYLTKKGRSPSDALQRIASNYYDYVIDVRTPQEWLQGHHPNAISIPIGELISKVPETVQRKDARILFVCKRGIRSKAAASMARDLGYKNVEWVSGIHNGLR